VLAEPVGSCTDLVATVLRPLESVYQKPMRLAPYAVILKPGHGKRILGNHAKAGFSPQAAYIFRKQIEEADLVLPHAAANGLDIIRLVAPTTDADRLPLVLNGSSGFVYYVSITGITGTRTASGDELAEAIPRIRKVTNLPIAIGFGVRSPEQAANAVKHADGAVVASALIDTMKQDLEANGGKPKPDTVARILGQVKALAAGVRGARVPA
jgi:tryptophan synthase alpha subunit